MSNVRELAVQILIQVQQQKAFAQELLEQTFQQVSLSDVDRRLLTELVNGTIRQQGALDVLLSEVVKRPQARVEKELWETLRLGAYQLAYLDSVPSHAAVHETVELATMLERPKAKGFLNGALRNLDRLLDDQPVTEPSAHSFPVKNDAYRHVQRPMFHDPKASPMGYLAQACSLPRWLVKRWYRRFDFEECLRMARWFASSPTLWLRCNPRKIDREELLKKLPEASAGEHPQAIRLAASMPIREIPGFEEGWFTVQDESAMWVASMLAPQPGQRILDLCAAPGGKTIHMAELMDNQGEIVACDIDERRLAHVTDTAQRLGIDIIRSYWLASSGKPNIPEASFDGVLVDVPCSNTGVLGRRPEARWRVSLNEIQELTELQKKILNLAIDYVKPGGSIVYSTCSIEPEENQKVVQAILRERPELTLIEEVEQRPGQPSDGGYRAKLTT